MGSDLYISFKNANDNWTKPRNFGAGINSEYDEWRAILSFEGKYLFFSSRRTGNGDIYWVDAKIIEELRSKELNKE